MFGSRYSQNANPFESPVAVSMTRLNDRSGPNDDSNSFTSNTNKFNISLLYTHTHTHTLVTPTVLSLKSIDHILFS